MKHNIITIVLSIALLVVIAPIGGLSAIGGFDLGHSLLLVVSAILFSLLTIWRLNNSERKTLTIVSIALPPALLIIPLHVLYFDETTVSLPSGVFHFVGILFGALIFFSKNSVQKIGLSSLLLLLCAGMYFKGYEMIVHKLDYGTYFGEITKPAPDFKLEDEEGKVYTNADFKNKTLVIDFWTTSCGVCFRKFPKLEELYSKSKDRNDLVIVAVNIQLTNDTKEKAIKMIRERGYTFKIFFADQKITNERFEFNAYPITFIIKDGSQIAYKGGIENVKNLIFN